MLAWLLGYVSGFVRSGLYRVDSIRLLVICQTVTYPTFSFLRPIHATESTLPTRWVFFPGCFSLMFSVPRKEVKVTSVTILTVLDTARLRDTIQATEASHGRRYRLY